MEGGWRTGRMALALPKSYAPMDALLVDDIPRDQAGGARWQYEPKWDGFRCIAFREGKRVDLESKSGKPLTRYFPEIADAVLKVDADRFVLDGEIAIPRDHSLSFDDLLQRIHPSASRIAKLSKETPAVLIAFDLLIAPGGKLLADQPLEIRRPQLEALARKFTGDSSCLLLSPATTSVATARKWFAGVGGALDGVIAKRLDLPYQSGNRHGMVKIKSLRTADCVVGGFRYATGSKAIGSLLLGLYNERGLLDHVGFCSAFEAKTRKALAAKVIPLIEPPGFTGNAPGGPSRWSTQRSTQWQPLATKLVVEVRYDHFTGGRFRHGTKFLRWRPDKAPAQCKMEQVERETTVSPLKLISRGKGR
jgi:ATP-dependent DNA ligase